MQKFSYLTFSFREVFTKPPYIIISIIVFLSILSLAIWLPNINFLRHTATSDLFTLSQKIGITSSLLGGIKTNFSVFSRITTITIAFLFAINISFFVFYIIRASKINKSSGLGTFGIILGMVGIGCASCGSVLITSIFGLTATAGFLGFLPLKGQEFAILSIVIISLSIYLLAKKIKDPSICNTKPRKLFTLNRN